MAHLALSMISLCGHAVEELEGPAMAGQPGRHLLVGDDLGIHVPAEAQGHDKDPCLNRLAGKDIDDGGTFAKIHLGGLCRCKVQHTGDFGVCFANFFNRRRTEE